MKQRVSQCVATMVLLAACVGVPALLVAATGAPWVWPWADLAAGWHISRPVSSRHVVYGLMAATWALWAYCVALVVVEVWNATVRRGLPPLRLPGGSPAQPVVRRLVAAALMTAAAAPVGTMAHAAPTPASPAAESISITQEAAPSSEIEAIPVVEGVVQPSERGPAPSDSVPQYVVQQPEQSDYDCLWDIAERHLGDPMRWRDIMNLNQNPDLGVVIDDPDLIQPGWVLRMPADAVGLPGDSVGTPSPGGITHHAGDADHPETGSTLEATARPDNGRALNPGAGDAAADPGSDTTMPAPRVDADQALDRGASTGSVLSDAAKGARAALGELVRATTGDASAVVDDADTAATDTAGQGDASARGGETSDATVDDAHPGTSADTSGNATPRGAASGGVAPGSTVSGGSTVPMPNVADDATRAIPMVPSAPEILLAPGQAAATVSSDGASLQRAADGVGVLADRVLDGVATPGAASVVAGCGITTLLAGGLLGVVGTRRMRQRNQRQPGQRIAMPLGVAADAERQFRAVPSGVSADVVDAVLRQVAAELRAARRPFPALHGLHVSRHTVSMYCAETVPPVGDWSVDDAAPLQWTLPTSAVAGGVMSREAADRPYPALVVVGQDPDGGVLLLDGETAGVLSFTGPRAVCVAAQDALLVELLTSPWSASCEITVVASEPQEVSVLTADSRVRQTSDLAAELGRVARRMDERRSILAEDGHDSVLAARSADQTRDVWAPHVIFIRTPLTAEQRETVRDIADEAAGVGVMFVTAGGEPIRDWEVRFAADAHLGASVAPETPLAATFLPGDTVIWPQVLPPQLRDHVAELLATTTKPATPGPTWAVTVAPSPTFSESVSPSEVPALKPVSETPELNVVEPVCVKLLGPIDVTGAPGEPPRSVGMDQHHAVTELLALLLLRDEPVTPADVSQLVSGRSGPWSERTVHTRLAQARAWLGEDAAGNLRVPHVAQGEPLVLSAEVTSDWAVFLDAVGPDIAGKTAGELLAALRLVSGPPCVGEGQASFSWAIDLIEEMTQSIVDVAHQCVTVALRDHQLAVAREAAAIGRLVDPYSDLMWQHSLRIEGLAGDAPRRDELQREYREVSRDAHLEPSAELSGLLAATAGSAA